MDPRLLRYYNRELQHVREMGAEFAREYPKIAGRLGMDSTDVADPYVERLLEGFAFLAARVQLKIDAEFPDFTQNLLELVYPDYLAPLPSMAVVQFEPIMEEGALADGLVVPRHTSLQSITGRGERTACEFRTAHDVSFWPIEVTEAKYYNSAGALATIDVNRLENVRAGIRLRLHTTGGLAFSDLSIDKLMIFLKGTGQVPYRLYEQLLGNTTAVLIRPQGKRQSWADYLPGTCLRGAGFQSSESLLPPSRRSFEGYRYLREYFAFPERFLFTELSGLQQSVSKCASTELEVIFLFNRRDTELENIIDRDNFALNCTPVINLFPKRADRIHLSGREHEFHVLPDRTRPMDFEVWSVGDVVGYGTSADPEQEFHPFYACHDQTALGETAFFTARRQPRRLSSRQRKKGTRSSYIGSETFVSVVDPNRAPYRSDLRQLGVTTMCTNRDLPLHMPLGKGQTDFTLDTGAPVESIRCIAGPTKPKPSFAGGDITWRLISHLSLNYLSLVDGHADDGASALRSLLSLYADENDQAALRQIEGLRSIRTRAVNERIPTDGPIAFGRGLEVTLTCEDTAFEGIGVFLLGSILKEFFAKYVSVNSFTKTVLESTERGEVMRWTPKLGQVQIL
jgi:type VI secretion system protein ImpG